MKSEIIITVAQDKKYVIQLSEKYELTKDLFLTVPRQIVAIAYIDGKPLYKSNPCTKQNVLQKCGQEYKAKDVQFAFYSPHYTPTIQYGFGPVHVNNERLKEAYRVGLHGEMIVSFKDPIKLIHFFTFSKSISVEDIRERMIPTIKTVGLPILSSCFANTKISVFEIDSMIGLIREKMTEAFVQENALDQLGIHVESMTIHRIYVHEDDLKIIRERINS